MQENIETIKTAVKEFFKKMTVEIEIESATQTEQTLAINLKASEPQLLIGEAGQTLLEIQQLLKAVLRRKTGEIFFLDLDVNDYKKKKAVFLKEMANAAADEVSLSKKEKWLPIMPAYERRIIHLELALREDVLTESIGEEPERRVVIKPR